MKSILRAYYDAYRIALFTGMRTGEIRAFEWENIDYRNQVVHVNGTLKFEKGNHYFNDTPKTNTSQRDIPMLDGVTGLLKSIKRSHPNPKQD